MKYIFAIIFVAINLHLAYSQDGNKPCENYEGFRQLDYWVGDWEVRTPNNQIAGHNSISIILDGCVIEENWTGATTSRGKSLNYYNPQTKKWHQNWVDNFGNPLNLIGEVVNDTIVYRGNTLNIQSGAQTMNEMMLAKVTTDEVHQVWRQSIDQGETWTVVFDGQYLRQKK